MPFLQYLPTLTIPFAVVLTQCTSMLFCPNWSKIIPLISSIIIVIKSETQRHPDNMKIIIGAQSNDHSAHLAGVSTKNFFTDACTFASVQLLVTEYYQLDVLSNFWDVYNIEAEALGQKVIYHPGSIPDVDRTRPLISTPSDLDRISPPDPYTSGRMPWILQSNKLFLEMTGKLDRVYFTWQNNRSFNRRHGFHIVET